MSISTPQNTVFSTTLFAGKRAQLISHFKANSVHENSRKHNRAQFAAADDGEDTVARRHALLAILRTTTAAFQVYRTRKTR